MKLSEIAALLKRNYEKNKGEVRLACNVAFEYADGKVVGACALGFLAIDYAFDEEIRECEDEGDRAGLIAEKLGFKGFVDPVGKPLYARIFNKNDAMITNGFENDSVISKIAEMIENENFELKGDANE